MLNTIVTSLDEYQLRATKTAIYPERGSFGGIIYAALKLNGEAGEVAEKLGKIIRDKESIISESDRQEIIKELGDVLWYVAALARELNSTMAYVANTNLTKLAKRASENKLSGSGDNR